MDPACAQANGPASAFARLRAEPLRIDEQSKAHGFRRQFMQKSIAALLAACELE